MATLTKYVGSDTNVVVPESIDGYRVIAIGKSAFEGYTSLLSVELPKTLTSIGDKAFKGCWQLESITLPANLETLGDYVFEECSKLADILILSKKLSLDNNYPTNWKPFKNAGALVDEGMTVTFAEGCLNVPANLFADDGSNLKKVVFSSTITTIGEKAFFKCRNLQNVTLPESLTSIGLRAFAGCSEFTSVTLPAKLETLGERSFDGTIKLTEIIIKSVALKNIGDSYGANGQPFYSAGTSADGITVTFAEGCTKVPGNIFYARDNGVAPNLKKVVMADTVKEVGINAFASCVFLEDVQMGNGVTTIGNSAFFNCAMLKELDLSDNLTTIVEYAFKNCSELNNIELPDTLSSIGEYAFMNCYAFTKVTLPVKLTVLGERAFQNCTGLTEIVVKSANIKDIGNSYNINGQPFYGSGTSAAGITVTFAEGCTRVPGNMFYTRNSGVAPNVKKVAFAETVKEIGVNAFNSCVYLEDVQMGNGVSNIGESAFYGCTMLKELVLSEKLTAISKSAFANCSALEKVQLPETLSSIGESAFSGCSALGNVTFPNALNTIGNYAFADCQSFTSVTLPAKLSVLGERAFQNCPKITEIRIKSASMKDIGNSYGVNGQPFYCAGSATGGIVVTFERGVRRIPGNLFNAHDGGSVAANIVEVNVPAGVREIGKYAFANCTALKKITFKGRACTFAKDAVFAGVEANAYHPGWPEASCQDYGGDITWIGYELPIIRLGGQTRFDTAIKVANEMKEQLGVAKFDAFIIASGNDFADALAGSYLATVKNAPILLTWNGDSRFNYLNNNVADYVKENLAEGGTVYILGGTAAVPASVDALLEGYELVRLAGANRFETNLMILEEAGVADGAEVLVCTSTNFADSLSASATAKPILLVFNELGKLYGKQPEFLASLKEKRCTFTVIGGENAVSFKLETAVSNYGITTRLAGANRFETSVKVAERYFDEPTSVVLAYAWNYPDGLCGGALAYSVDAPLILTMNKYEGVAAEYAQGQDVNTGFVLGSDALISDNTVRIIFSLKADHQITSK